VILEINLMHKKRLGKTVASVDRKMAGEAETKMQKV